MIDRSGLWFGPAKSPRQRNRPTPFVAAFSNPMVSLTSRFPRSREAPFPDKGLLSTNQIRGCPTVSFAYDVNRSVIQSKRREVPVPEAAV